MPRSAPPRSARSISFTCVLAGPAEATPPRHVSATQGRGPCASSDARAPRRRSGSGASGNAAGKPRGIVRLEEPRQVAHGTDRARAPARVRGQRPARRIPCAQHAVQPCVAAEREPRAAPRELRRRSAGRTARRPGPARRRARSGLPSSVPGSGRARRIGGGAREPLREEAPAVLLPACRVLARGTSARPRFWCAAANARLRRDGARGTRRSPRSTGRAASSARPRLLYASNHDGSACRARAGSTRSPSSTRPVSRNSSPRLLWKSGTDGSAVDRLAHQALRQREVAVAARPKARGNGWRWRCRARARAPRDRRARRPRRAPAGARRALAQHRIDRGAGPAAERPWHSL